MIIRLPKKRSAVYLLKKAGVVVYVGASRDVIFRFTGHRWKVFDEIEIVWTPEDELSDRERRLIEQYKPKLNKHRLSKETRPLLGKKIAAGNNFWVGTEKERGLARQAAKYVGAKIHAAENKTKGGFDIYFLNPAIK